MWHAHETRACRHGNDVQSEFKIQIKMPHWNNMLQIRNQTFQSQDADTTVSMFLSKQEAYDIEMKWANITSSIKATSRSQRIIPPNNSRSHANIQHPCIFVSLQLFPFTFQMPGWFSCEQSDDEDLIKYTNSSHLKKQKLTNYYVFVGIVKYTVNACDHKNLNIRHMFISCFNIVYDFSGADVFWCALTQRASYLR